MPAVAGLLISVLLSVPVLRAQQQPVLSGEARSEVSSMMQDAYNEVKKHYYDPKLHGLDWDARYKQYSARIANAHDLGEGFRTVAAFLSGLKDSHTFFVPPTRTSHLDTGYRYALVGNACYITQLRPKSDAASKLHIGDQVLGINGFSVDRDDFHDVRYFFDILAPQMSYTLDLRSPAGEQRRVVVNAATRPSSKFVDLTEGSSYYDMVRRDQDEDHTMRDRVVESGDATIWKLQQFYFDYDDVTDYRREDDYAHVDKVIGIARKHKTLILDLRGNHGGAVDTLKLIVGALFDHDIKICDRVGKSAMKPMIAKPLARRFDGKLIVLVDGSSASAAELLARVVQLEHRGTVIGDKTSGAVMEAMFHSEALGADTKIFYGFSVTDANLMMSDGKSLENTGVVPDELLMPTGADLAAGSDPVLVRAAELGGVKLDPVEAGKMFPYEWMPL